MAPQCCPCRSATTGLPCRHCGRSRDAEGRRRSSPCRHPRRTTKVSGGVGTLVAGEAASKGVLVAQLGCMAAMRLCGASEVPTSWKKGSEAEIEKSRLVKEEEQSGSFRSCMLRARVQDATKIF
ncbi:hypothetical protein E2562_034530 [Oryza meyeriana var. granulata]|uniref:Uncharacterized protein n=1 Tax=Oryza meyeriana var. granulata TaxID=110450 RepID=A0A6G1CAN1_9ORYZ|nr:hypothetical protein E2562_034530 [Oryza meyeriana var. granulata]